MQGDLRRIFNQLPQIPLQIFLRLTLVDIKAGDFGLEERFDEKNVILESLGNCDNR